MVPMDIINIYENFNSYFSSEFKEIFKLCSNVGYKQGYKLYLIGGLVRDMLLNKESLDIDITVEGDAIEFAYILERESNAKISSIHKDFGTVKVKLNGMDIDLASTRSEIYPKKGHLPKVSEIGCSLEKDVLRRDFTINSLAMSLNKDNFADLIDFVNGFEDLKAKKIKILHNRSFIDDPTRIIRALRYSSRFGFKLDEKTLSLQQEYLNNVDYDMCNKRLKQEFKKTFDSSKSETFERFIQNNIYKLFTQRILTVPLVDFNLLFETYRPKNIWFVYFGFVILEEDINLLELTNQESKILSSAKELLATTYFDDFELYKAFENQKTETLLILALYDRLQDVLHYLEELKKISLNITGKDILELGFLPSPLFKKGLDYVLKQKLKTPALCKKDELSIVKLYLENH